MYSFIIKNPGAVIIVSALLIIISGFFYMVKQTPFYNFSEYYATDWVGFCFFAPGTAGMAAVIVCGIIAKITGYWGKW